MKQQVDKDKIRLGRTQLSVFLNNNSYNLIDDGLGNLLYENKNVGLIDYRTGQCTINESCLPNSEKMNLNE